MNSVGMGWDPVVRLKSAPQINKHERWLIFLRLLEILETGLLQDRRKPIFPMMGHSCESWQ